MHNPTHASRSQPRRNQKRMSALRSRFCFTALQLALMTFCACTTDAQTHATMPASTQSAPPELPAGLWLPVFLVRGMDTAHACAGQRVAAHTMQHIPLGNHQFIPEHALLEGHVVACGPGTTGGSAITFTFDTLHDHHAVIPIKVSLIALASLLEMNEATIPTNGGDRGTSYKAWTMVQIGGDVVYHGGLRIDNDRGEQVGTEDIYGNYAFATADGPPGLPLAVGEFSTTAKGVYGLPGYHIQINAPGPASPQITVTSETPRTRLPSGAGMLLRVIR